MTFGRYPSMLRRPFTGELGIRKVLLEDVAEFGVFMAPEASWLTTVDGAPDPNMDAPPGVDGWAMVVVLNFHAIV